MNALLRPSLISLGWAFNLQPRGTAGALALTIVALAIDYHWFRFRVRSYQGRTSLKPFSIIGVFLLRLVTLCVLLMFGAWWLEPAAQQSFYCAMLTLPFWNLLVAAKS